MRTRASDEVRMEAVLVIAILLVIAMTTLFLLAR